MNDVGQQDVEQAEAGAAEESSLRQRLMAFAAVSIQLALVLAVIHLFDIEPRRHFFSVMCIVCVGFFGHSWLPARMRLGFFALYSMAAVFFVLGWPNGAWVLGLGCGLIVCCYLPLPLWLRVTLLVFAAAMLAVFRMESTAPFWVVLAAMFMIRLIFYVFETRRDKTRPPLASALAYFFQLPNICFFFYPAVSFKTFRDTYASRDPALHQIGIEWIVRGIVHLLVYRAIKYFLLPSPFELRDTTQVLVFLATNYALYLHISAHFHIITGVLHLFGFGLPRTHDNYFLASSFTDVWRRINIYWTDFMTKVFFFPSFFALRGIGTRAAAVLATLLVFLATWLLHAYQYFWLRNELAIRLRDAILWLTVGILVAINLQRELRRAGQPRAPSAQDTAIGAALHGIKIAGMFWLISFFWASWTVPGFFMNVPVLTGEGEGAAAALGWIVAVFVAAALVGAAWHVARTWLRAGDLLPLATGSLRPALVATGVLGVLALLGSPLMARWLDPAATEKLTAFKQDSFTPLEASQLVAGYYEEVTTPGLQAGAWLRTLEGNPLPEKQVHYSELTRPTDDLLEHELIPSRTWDISGVPLTVNAFGMRDRADLTQHKPAGTCRIAVVGTSIVMGFGVGDDETFPRLVEDRLNAARPKDRPRYELLNFGLGKTCVTHRRALLDRKVFSFAPDAVFYVAHPDEFSGATQHLVRLLDRGTKLPYPAMRDVLEKAGITVEMAPGEVDSRLQPFGRDLALGLYREIVADCRGRGILPVWIYLPVPGAADAAVRPLLLDAAAQAGFRVIDLAGWMDRHGPRDVLLHSHEHHPNALGQRLIAERLYAELLKQPDALPACK